MGSIFLVCCSNPWRANIATYKANGPYRHCVILFVGNVWPFFYPWNMIWRIEFWHPTASYVRSFAVASLSWAGCILDLDVSMHAHLKPHPWRKSGCIRVYKIELKNIAANQFESMHQQLISGKATRGLKAGHCRSCCVLWLLHTPPCNLP